MSNKWVDIVMCQGDDYTEMANEVGEDDTTAIAEYLTQWDYGDETDAAHTLDAAPWGSSDTIEEISIGNIVYTLSINRPLGYAALARRPLDAQ